MPKPEFDAAVERHLAGPYEAARSGDYDGLARGPGKLSRVDPVARPGAPQPVPRFRARFESDAKALELARHALANKFDSGLLIPSAGSSGCPSSMPRTWPARKPACALPRPCATIPRARISSPTPKAITT